MITHIHPYQIIIMIGSVLSIIISINGWSRRKTIEGPFFLAYNLALTEWFVCETIVSFVAGLENKIIWTQISYIGFVQVIPFLFLFLITFIQQRKVKKTTILWFLLIPALTIIAAWTNSLHGWLWSGFYQVSAENQIYIFQRGFWFWIYFTYVLVLLLFSFVYVFQAFTKASPSTKKELSLILLGCIFPIISIVLYLTGRISITGFDISPYGFVLAGALFIIYLVRYRGIELLPLARIALVEQLQDGVIVLDSKGIIADINQSSQKLCGWSTREVIGKSLRQYLPELADIAADVRTVNNKEMAWPCSSDVVVYVQCSKLFSRKNNDAGTLMVIRDISLRHRAEVSLQNANAQMKTQLAEITQLQKKLEEQALHDSLTGLFNRRVDEFLEKEFSRARRTGSSIGMAVIDIDNFKGINDQFGHLQGDLLLKSLADLLKESIRREDYAARFGGDELILVFPGMDQAETLHKAEEIREKFELSENRNGELKIHSTITIGIANFPENGETFEQVFKAADLALYTAKESGKNKVQVAGSPA